ncbi:hypothetical protein BDN72DRAFT_669957 [Pluteus cervinus]|uniref:Uncharacterized protein n=1 Tax=Pluteus cervinus TaxID=181527 RepID=A0ACD3B9B5_9AGAR|nr:hypothetical protein BDN72DRAFT_669957 [Pluteus cervinus]
MCRSGDFAVVAPSPTTGRPTLIRVLRYGLTQSYCRRRAKYPTVCALLRLLSFLVYTCRRSLPICWRFRGRPSSSGRESKGQQLIIAQARECPPTTKFIACSQSFHVSSLDITDAYEVDLEPGLGDSDPEPLASPAALPVDDPEIQEGLVDEAILSPASSDFSQVFLQAKLPELGSLYSRFNPIPPCQTQRHYAKPALPRILNRQYLIEPCAVLFEPTRSHRWGLHVHPAGTRYFTHLNPQDYKLPFKQVMTDANLDDFTIFSLVEECLMDIYTYFQMTAFPIGRNLDLVLDVVTSAKGDLTCHYYFANHEDRSITWLDKFDARIIFSPVQTQVSPSLAAQELESQYWHHCELYPHCRDLERSDLAFAKDTLILALGDMLTTDSWTSSASQAPYDAHDLQRLINLVGECQDGHGTQLLGSRLVVYRLLSVFAHERFLNLHGETEARQRRVQSIHDDSGSQRLSVFRIVDILLFNTPLYHLRRLEKLIVDSHVKKAGVIRVREATLEEWREFTLYASVLLNANVAFLAAQIGEPKKRLIAQRASYVSTFFSVAAVILGLWLSRRHHAQLKMSFLRSRSSPSGLQTLAMWYSLPSALFTWSMLAFFVAFSAMCCRTPDVFTKALLGAASAGLVFLLVWCIISLSEGKGSNVDTLHTSASYQTTLSSIKGLSG